MALLLREGADFTDSYRRAVSGGYDACAALMEDWGADIPLEATA